MAEKIEISDQRLARRVDAAVADLERFYPDKKVYSLDKLHKGLSNRVGELWPLIGYESRDAFFTAYGFELVRKTSGGAGRPVTFDPEKLFSELAARYEGVEKPSSIGTLIHENPDLKASLKTFQNKSSELFGETSAKVLRKRGILANAGKKTGKTGSEITDDEIQSMLDALAAKYAGASVKPSSMAELKIDNPEYKAVIAAFYARAKMMYRTTPRRKLVKLGIFSASNTVAAIPIADASVDEIEGAIDELGEMLCDLPAQRKPKTIDALTKAYPEQGGFIGVGKKKGLIDGVFLQELGILAPSKSLIKRKGVRKVAPEGLLPLFIDAVGEIYIEPGDECTWYLPPYIVGIDIAKGVELREAIISVGGDTAKTMAAGQTCDAKVFRGRNGLDFHYYMIQVSGQRPERTGINQHIEIFNDIVKESASKLAEFEGAFVVSVSEFESQSIAQLRFRYLARIRSDTMVYALRRMGIVTDADLVGGMGWRFRVRKAAKGAFEIAKPPKSSSEATPSGVVGSAQLNYSGKVDLTSLAENKQMSHEAGGVAYGCSEKAASDDSVECVQIGNGPIGIADISREFNLDSTPQSIVHYGVSSK